MNAVDTFSLSSFILFPPSFKYPSFRNFFKLGVSACFPTELCYYRRLILCINKTSLCFVLSNISVFSRKINESGRGFRLKVFISAVLFSTYDKYRHICYSVNRHNQTFSLKNHQHLCLFIYVCVHFVFVPAVLTKFLFIFFHYLFVLFCLPFYLGLRGSKVY
jgi:hypothetical protein